MSDPHIFPVGPNGRVALVDQQDYDLVSQYEWRERHQRNTIYAFRRWWEDGHSHMQRMHSLITGWSFVDHIDHNGLNNQRSNLRQVTNRQNQQNQISRRGSSEYKGVHWDTAAQRWRAQICVDGHGIYLGRFADESDAARAYDAAALEHFGEFACINLERQVGS